MKELDPIMISQLSQSLEIDLQEKRSIEELKLILSTYINDLINHDFNKLMRILYRVDVSEKVLKENLQKYNEDAAAIIAGMIIERQLQKMKTRERFQSNNDISEDEKW
jgi:hypothetical protein